MVYTTSTALLFVGFHVNIGSVVWSFRMLGNTDIMVRTLIDDR